MQQNMIFGREWEGGDAISVFFMTRGMGSVHQFPILADKGGGGNLNPSIFGSHHISTAPKHYSRYRPKCTLVTFVVSLAVFVYFLTP